MKKKSKLKLPVEQEIPQEETLKGREEVYCFTNYGITINATSQEEAEKKLKEILKEE